MSSLRLLKVGVLLSGREQFSPFYGGALARWTYEVYRRLRDRMEVTVFGFPTSAEHLYDLSHRSSAVWRACDVLYKMPFLRRWDHGLARLVAALAKNPSIPCEAGSSAN